MENRIREAREAIGMSQGELARQMGLTQGAISQWEHGLAIPSTVRLKMLARVLGTTIDELIA